MIAPLQSWVVHKYYNAAILNAKAEARRLAKIKLEEEQVISAVEKAKGIKKFAPIYSLPQPTEDKPSAGNADSGKKKNAAKKKKSSGNQNKKASSDYQGKKKK